MTTTIPQSRNEAILHYALGEEVELEAPQSRMEELLIEVADLIRQGGGGGGSMETLTLSTIDGTVEYDGSTARSVSADHYFVGTAPVPGGESWSDDGADLPNIYEDSNAMRTYYYPALIVNGSDLFTLGDVNYALDFEYSVDGGEAETGTVYIFANDAGPGWTNGKAYHSGFGAITLKPSGVNDDEYVLYCLTTSQDTQAAAEALTVAYDFTIATESTPGSFSPRSDMSISLPAFSLTIGSDSYTYDGGSAVSVVIQDGDQGSY